MSKTLTWIALPPEPSLLLAPIATFSPSEVKETEIPELSEPTSPSISAICIQLLPSIQKTRTWPALFPPPPAQSCKVAPIAT